MLAFHDAAGRLSGRFVFPSNAPSGGTTVLVATRAFAELTGLTPDFVMPPEVVPIAGKMVFQTNPDNPQFAVNIALSYGGAEYFGGTDGAGPAAVDALPILGAHSLGRTQEVPFGVNQNQAFTLGLPSPRNTAGGTLSLASVTLAEQGRTLFMHETFRGNGRTCATCHVPGRDQFGLTPLTIAELDEDDPLFVFEANVNRLRLAGWSQPGDLRGTVSGGTGSARILSGSGDSYLVVGGAELGGTITDAAGNHATFVSWTPGDLEGPTASNGSVRGLEDHRLLEHGRGLILENIDGFRRGEVFRASPHLLNLGLTAPFGLSGEFGNLEDFSEGAVAQHFPKSLARRSGVDFRTPTREELEAMTAFMLGISNPSTNDLNLDRLATTEAQRRGRALFFGDEGRCAKCHSGPVLAFSDGSLTNSVKGRNENFNTGVANLLRNLPAVDNLPTEPAGLVPGRSTRAFNTPSLFNIRLTAPYFHDGSAETLTEAVRFYDSEEFNASPAGREIGSLLAANRPEKVADLVAFLEALIELPMDFQRELAFGVRCPGESPPGTLTVGVTNISAHFITITNVFINGTNAADFVLAGDTGGTILAPGAVRQVTMAFQPQAPGLKRATLEFGGWDTNGPGRLDFGVALSGGDIDNMVHVTPVAVGFATRDIDAPPSPGVSIVITNNGSTELALAGIGLGGTNAADFIFQMETSVVPPHGSRVGTVSFAPGTQGVKTAVIRGEIISCNTNRIEIPLTGEASSTVHHFAWDALAPTQFVGVPLSVRVAALDRNGETVTSFNGTVNLFTVVGSQTNTTFATPTNSTPFIQGVWNGNMTAIRQATTMRLLARDDAGHAGISTAFAAPLRDDLSLAVLDVPDPVLNGGNLTYVLSVNNTGPATATGVVLTNVLPAGVSFKSGTNNLGSFVHAGGMVTWSIGTLGPAVTAVLSLTVEPAISAGGTTLLNVASVSRNEPEFVVGNNTVTNTTLCGTFGSLVVLPDTNFFSTALSGALFTPSSHALVLSNNGTASLNWQVLEADCVVCGWNVVTPSSGSLAAGSSTNVILAFADSASDQLPPGLHTNTMVFTNLSVGRGTTDRKIGVGVINRRPTLRTPLAITVSEDSGIVEFQVQDILPGGREIQNLTVTATSGNPALIPSPIRVTFSNSLPTATIAFTSATNANGSTLLSVVVRDDGGTILSGIDASTNDVSVTILPVNDAPVMLPPPDRLASPGTTVGFNVVATDVDLPSDHLTFALGPGAAPGAAVNPVSGFFSWVVPVAPVPSTNRFTLTVTDDGSPALGDSRSFSIVVFPQPVIQSVRRTNATVQLTWSSVPGARYRVQWKARLEDAEWADVSGEILASGGSATWSDVATPLVRGFYRVSVVP